ncbi:hypothetical protein [Thalassospira sp. TSL5-1]|nr:hypothetical protein [Thalassospira sp. TSL5-1]OKH87855.1 hypothetical protein LF95_14125 [Thalassospira sp. TSL5-1]
MDKDELYYKDRLYKKERERLQELTSGLSDQEFLKIPEEVLEEVYAETKLYRIKIFLREAEAMISALVSDTPDVNGKYSFSWVSLKSYFEDSKRMTASRTKEEMIKKLEWISNEEFGDDLDEWQSWIRAFKSNPPMRYK